MHIFSPINNEKDVIAQLLEDRNVFEAQQSDCMVKSMPLKGLRIPSSMTLPGLTVTRRLNTQVEYTRGFLKTSGQLSDLVNNPGYNEQKISSVGGSNSKAIISGAMPSIPSRYQSQKHRDWETFCRYLNNHKPPISVPMCNAAHVLEFLKYLDQFGKTKVHISSCSFFGQSNPPGPCGCPLRQAWGSVDALVGRLSSSYEDLGGKPEVNPFRAGVVRIYLREVRDAQGKARGISYKKRKKSEIKVANTTTTTTNTNIFGCQNKRRQYRQKLEALNKLIKVRKPYMHESQHLHSLKRAIGNGGKFLNTEKLQQSKSTPTSHGPDMSRSPQLHLFANISETDVHQPKDFKDSGSATSCSDVISASNSDEMFQQPDFRFSSYPPDHTGEAMPCHAGNIHGDGNLHHHSSLFQ